MYGWAALTVCCIAGGYIGWGKADNAKMKEFENLEANRVVRDVRTTNVTCFVTHASV